MDQAARLRSMMQKNTQNITSGARVIAVTSGKGGVGKTSISVNLAIEIARLGKRVVIFDADFGLANVEVMLGIRPQYNLLDVVYNKKSIDEIISVAPGNIGFISGGSGVSELAALDSNNIKKLIAEMAKLDEMYDVVIIDTGAGITDSVMEFVMVSPEVLLVVTPEPTSITDAYSLLKVLRRKEDFNPLYKKIGIVANRVENTKEGQEIYSKINMVSTKFLNTKLDFAAAVTFDRNVSMAIIEQKPVVLAYPSSPVTKAIRELAASFFDEKVSAEKPKDGIAKVFSDFFKSRRKSR